MKLPHPAALIAACCLMLPLTPAHAGPAGEALARCADAALTKPDRNLLARWMFVSMSAYPDAQKLAPGAGAQADALNKGVATLFKRLVGQACSAKTAQAVQAEGPGAVEDTLKLLAQAGVREMLNDPAVSKRMQGLQKYMD